MVLASLVLGAALVAAQPDHRRDAALRAFLQTEFQHMRDASGSAPYIKYAAAFVDLNGDGRQEALVYVTGDGMCGSGGCDLYIYTPRGRSWREVTNLTVTRLPIRILNGRSHGWRDIGVFVAGGGILPGYHVQLKFNGHTYPSNPTVPPARPLPRGAPGLVLIGINAESRPLF